MSEKVIPYFRRMQMIKLGLLPPEAVAKAKKPIAKKSNKRIQQEKDNKENGSDGDMDRFFNSMRSSMSGVCHHCGGKSCKDDDTYFKFSLGHILPKAYFPSVETNPNNIIELCFWERNCHYAMDNKMLDLMDMNCFDEIVTKFVKIYPFIAADEKKRIPEILMQYVEVEK